MRVVEHTPTNTSTNFLFFLWRTLLARTSMRPRGSPTGVGCLEVGIHYRALMERPAFLNETHN